MNKLRIAIIGTGHLGKFHSRLLAQKANVENSQIIFSGVYDVNVWTAEDIAKECNTTCFRTLDSAIMNSDAVFIVVPTSEHYEIAKKCIENNKHCFIEKPAFASMAEAEQFRSLAMQHSDLKIQIGHIERFNPSLLAVKQYISNPQFIEAHRLSQFRPRATDVSVIHDLMIHDIDLVLWLMASPLEHIEANGVSVITDTTDIANARLTFADGAVANITASRISAKPMRKIRLFQRFGYVSVDLAQPKAEIFRLANENESVDSKSIPASLLGDINAATNDKKIVFEEPVINTTNAMADEQQSFIDAIINDTETAVPLADGIKALEVAEQIIHLLNVGA